MKVFVTTEDVANGRRETVGEMTFEEFPGRVQEFVQAKPHWISHEGVALVLRAAQT